MLFCLFFSIISIFENGFKLPTYDQIKDSVKSAKEKIIEGYENAKPIMKEKYESIKEGIENAKPAVQEGYESIKEGIQNVGHAIKNKYDEYQKEMNAPYQAMTEDYQKKMQEQLNEKLQEMEENQKKMNEQLKKLNKEFKEELDHIIEENQMPTQNFKLEERKIDHFEGFSISKTMRAIVTQGDEESLKIEAEESVLKQIQTKVENQFLSISLKNQNQNSNEINVIVHIMVKNLRIIQVSGVSQVIGKSNFQLNDIIVQVSGVSSVKLNINSKNILVQLSGVSNAVFQGNVNDAKFQVSGASKLKASSLVAQRVNVQVSGTSKAYVNAQKELSYGVSGISYLYYVSNPKIIKATCSQQSHVNHNEDL